MRSVTRSDRWILLFFMGIVGVALGETALRGLFEGGKRHPPEKVGQPSVVAKDMTSLDKAKLILYAGQTHNFVSALREVQTAAENKPSLESLNSSSVFRELSHVMNDNKITMDADLIKAIQQTYKEFTTSQWMERRMSEVADSVGVSAAIKAKLARYVLEIPDYRQDAVSTAVRRLSAN